MYKLTFPQLSYSVSLIWVETKRSIDWGSEFVCVFLHNQNGQLHALRWLASSLKQLFLEGVESKCIIEYHTDILHLINGEIIGFLCQLLGEFIFIKGLVHN